MRWLRSLAAAEDLTAASVARYHAHLVAGGRSTATVRKDRAALNTFLRWLVAHERLPAAQVRDALAVRLPRAQRAEPEPPKALTAAQYERLRRAAKARIADDPVAGARDLAIVRWDRERTRAVGQPADDAPLFITLDTRRRDGTYKQVVQQRDRGRVTLDEDRDAA